MRPRARWHVRRYVGRPCRRSWWQAGRQDAVGTSWQACGIAHDSWRELPCMRVVARPCSCLAVRPGRGGGLSGWRVRRMEPRSCGIRPAPCFLKSCVWKGWRLMSRDGWRYCVPELTAVGMAYWLVVGHFVMDYWGQSDYVAQAKNRHHKLGQMPRFNWLHVMTAHAGMHGGAVAVITGSVWLGVSETIAHWLIDFGKCDNKYGIHMDQALHYGCKVVWLIIAWPV